MNNNKTDVPSVPSGDTSIEAFTQISASTEDVAAQAVNDQEFMNLLTSSDNGWTDVIKKPKKEKKRVEELVDKRVENIPIIDIEHEDLEDYEIPKIEMSTGNHSETTTVHVPGFTGDGQEITVYKNRLELLEPIFKRLEKLNRVLRNPEHQVAYREVIKRFIKKMTEEYEPTKTDICLLKFVTGTGKTTIGVLMALVRALNYDEQLVVIVPRTELSKQMSISTEVMKVIGDLLPENQILNLAAKQYIRKEMSYRVIICNPDNLSYVLKHQLIKKKCTIVADEADFYLNDEAAITKTLFTPTSPQYVLTVQNQYEEIMAWYKQNVPFLKENKIITEWYEVIKTLVNIENLSKDSIKENKKKAKTIFVELRAVKGSIIDAIVKKYGTDVSKAYTAIKEKYDTYKNKCDRIISKIKVVDDELKRYIDLMDPFYEEGKEVRQPFTKLRYIIDVSVMRDCRRFLFSLLNLINGCDVKIIFADIKFGDLPTYITELDKFCSFFMKVKPTMLVAASATLNVPLMGWYTPIEVINRYLPPQNEPWTVLDFNHIVSPIKVHLINFSSPEIVDRITGEDDSKRKEKYWADLFSAKVAFYLEMCRLHLNGNNGRDLVQHKGSTLDRMTKKPAPSQGDYIVEALIDEYRKTGKLFTNDPNFYNDSDYDTILSNVDEATALRGLNFRVEKVIMFETGNYSNIKNLLQAIRVGRMCYNIEEEMHVVVMYRGYQSSVNGTTEVSVANKFADILEKQGCNINLITLNKDNTPCRSQANPRAPWPVNVFTGEPLDVSISQDPLSSVPERDLAPIIKANRPLVCACARKNCNLLHVVHYLNGEGQLRAILKPSEIEKITKHLALYPGFVPACCRLRSTCMVCPDFKRSSLQTVRCENFSQCKKAHYYRHASGELFQDPENESSVPVHIHCKRALTNAFPCNGRDGLRCSRRLVGEESNHQHDCQLAHCEEGSDIFNIPRIKKQVKKAWAQAPVKTNAWASVEQPKQEVPVVNTKPTITELNAMIDRMNELLAKY
jgi:hypothetical protein